MPHAEIKFSDDLTIDAGAMLREIEAIILSHDDGAGETKGRAYPAAIYNHTHLKIEIALLAKPHRTSAFLAALQEDLVKAIGAHLPRPCWLSIDLQLSSPSYHTELLT